MAIINLISTHPHLSMIIGKNPNTQLTTNKPWIKDIKENREGYQLSFFQLDDPVLSQVRDEIKSLDVNNLTPMEALNKLNEIKKIVSGK